jgi:hypothetical protein
MIPRWRRLVTAPVYAAVTAFAMVLVLGAVLPADQATVIRVVLAGGGELPIELTGLPVEMRDPKGAEPIMGALSQGSYTPSGSLAGRRVCAQVPDPWRVTDPPVVTMSQLVCTAAPLPDPPDTEVVLKVTRGVWVQARIEGQAEDEAAAVQGWAVKIRDGTTPELEESGFLDHTGRYVARRSLANQRVCLKTPSDWMVKSPETDDKDGLSCTADLVQDATSDVVFTLVRAGEGG